jgi:hypothetical protein
MRTPFGYARSRNSKRWTVEISRVSPDGGAIQWKFLHEQIQNYLLREGSF